MKTAPLPVVVGPTGSGKSDLAIRLAQAIGGEIVNCDSLQIYRGFDIGTAKVPPADRAGVPHHLIDIVEPAQLFTAGDYAAAARAILNDITGRGAVPIVVGGTGFYLRALLDGLFQGPPRSDELRTRLVERESRRAGSLHRILSRLDPTAAARIHANDKNKTIRALEVRLLEGKPISEMFATGRDALTGFHPVKIGLNPPRPLLYERVDERAKRIFECGLIDEVQRLLDSGVSRDAKPFESLGYKQALQVIEGKMTTEEAIASTQMETRRYSKRQMTWFRREPGVVWIDAFGDQPEALTAAVAVVAAARR
jgi:tRNA dimethylallyltransferase